MRLTISIAAILILVAGAATAGTVVLNDGDQISGKILLIEGNSIVIQNQHMGNVRVPLAAVKTIESDRAFTVVLGSGDQVSGMVEADGDGTMSIENESGVVTTPLGEISTMTHAPMALAFTDGVDPAIEDVASSESSESSWDGEIGLGFNWQTGNTERLGLVFDFKLEREDEDSKSAVRAGVIYTEDDDVRTANRQFLAVQHDIKFDDPWYFFGLLAMNRDEFKEIDFRGALTPGLGYNFGDNDEWKLSAEVGPTLTYTNWEFLENEWTFELFAAVKGELQVFDEARLIQNLFIYPSITNSPDLRILSETAFEQPLSDAMFLRIAFLVNYDTSVESPTKKTDTNLLVTLAIKF
jgi:putative salt-induced outer membrane protein YdiY